MHVDFLTTYLLTNRQLKIAMSLLQHDACNGRFSMAIGCIGQSVWTNLY